MGKADTILLTHPAHKWEDGLPLGNGRLGMMPWGRVGEEMIVLNEETLWYGPARNRRNPDGKAHVEEIRKLLREGQTEQAAFLAKMSMTGTPKYNNPYQPAGDLRIYVVGHQGKSADYRRMLHLPTGRVFQEYSIDGILYKREMFVSHAWQVGVVRLWTEDPKGNLTVCANIGRKPFEQETGRVEERTVGNWGQNGVDGVRYFSAVRMTADAKVRTLGDFVYTENAKEVVLFVDCETDFREDGGREERFREVCLERLRSAEAAGIEKIRARHLEEYGELYNRMDIQIGPEEPGEAAAGATTSTDMAQGIGESISAGTRTGAGSAASAPAPIDTAAMLASVKSGDPTYLPALTMLLLRYARCLLISSSTDCRLPANLQGLWNGSFEPPWQCEFTVNINTEMNYWFAEKSGLSECHKPLFRLLNRLAENGKETARELYGCDGFVVHHNTNLWANTDLEGIFDASPFWVTGGAWLSLHLYEHYLYTKDTEFLKTQALPIMREAIRFFEGYLSEDANGHLVTGPAVSPENTYVSKAGQRGALCMGPTMDTTILRQLITWYLEGKEIAGTVLPAEERTNLETILKKLPPLQISADGRIMEWAEDYEETEPGHRHISHLFGLHPGNEITPEKPELFAAAEKTLDYRLSHGGGHTGWSKAWITCFYARIGKGEAVEQNIRELLKRSVQDNMLTIHPPYQIDGNFGIAEAILEALIQSHAGYIRVLPALPKAWEQGALRGVGLRGGMTADMRWENGKLCSFAVTAAEDGPQEFVYGNQRQTVFLKKGKRTEVSF
ncbi:MAG: glycoside hydrolase family 95 protein [Eubacteriales bacterium]|nr:glycoside hydrolase family 95 protein [Eubacteriales bacterium]